MLVNRIGLIIRLPAEARLTKPGDFNNIAICARASDDGQSECIFMLEGKRQQAVWWKKIGGQYTEIKTVALKIDTKDWFQIYYQRRQV